MTTTMERNAERLKQSLAQVGSLPSHSGDGYGYGGGTILMIGDRAIELGEGYEARQLAEELARRWNAALLQTPQPDGLTVEELRGAK